MYTDVCYLLRRVAACCCREKPQRSLNVMSTKSLRRKLPCLSRLISSARQHVLCYSDTCSVSHSGLCSHCVPSKRSGGSISRGSVVKSVWYTCSCNSCRLRVHQCRFLCRFCPIRIIDVNSSIIGPIEDKPTAGPEDAAVSRTQCTFMYFSTCLLLLSCTRAQRTSATSQQKDLYSASVIHAFMQARR